MWIAPNLVTLLGFFFILGNVALLELYIPDLVGPVSHNGRQERRQGLTAYAGAVMGLLQLRIRHVGVRPPNAPPRQNTALTTPQLLDHGQRRRQAGAPHRNIQPARRALRVRDNKPNAPIRETDLRKPRH